MHKIYSLKNDVENLYLWGKDGWGGKKVLWEKNDVEI